MSGPQKCETPLAGGAPKNKNQTADGLIIRSDENERNRFAILAARFALSGHALIQGGELGDCRLYCVRWGWIKPLRDLDEAEAMLCRIGGRV